MDTKENLEFIMLMGIPASGKSTAAAEYKKRGYAVFSSDEIRAETEEKLKSGALVMPSNTNLNAMVFDHIKALTVKALKEGQSVVLDATNLGRKRRMNFKNALGRIPCVKICMLFITSPKECSRRNELREGAAKVPEEAMYRMFCGFECPNFWEGWDKIIPVADSIPYRFEYEKTVGFPQETPHHSLTLDEHMQAAYALAAERGFSERVQKVAKCHDIGKLYTKRFENRRGERTEWAHFYGHENYGAYLYLAENCCGKDLTEEEFKAILYETNLINCHMRPLTVWKDSVSAREKDKRLFGEEFFQDLVDLNICDKAAH
nr:ATP-binding protein [Clostridia bacterium]